MKTVYILAEGFAPRSVVGAIRTTKIAKYCSEDNYKVVVFSKELNDTPIDRFGQEDIETIKKNDGEIIRVNCEISYPIKKILGLLYRVGARQFSGLCISLINSWKYKREHIKKLGKIEIPKPDVVISSYGPFGGHFLGMYFKQLYQEKVVWIADYRDPVYSIAPKERRIYCRFADSFMRKVLLSADYITAIVDTIPRRMNHLKGYTPDKVFVIMNGYDSEDYDKICLEYEKTCFEDKFILSYSGTMYADAHKRDMGIVFVALDELIKEGKMVKKDIEVHYAGSQFQLFKQRVPKGICDIKIIDNGYISRNEALLLQQRSAILLFPSQNIIEEQVVTGKIFEYFMAKRLILGIIEGNTANGISRKMIDESNCGFCYEKANHTEDYPKMKEFILNAYEKWRSGNRPMPNPNMEYVSQFDWKNNVKNFERLFEK